jgi:hypothetical protein
MYTFLKLSETTSLCCNDSSENSVSKGRTIGKVIRGEVAKIKISQGKQKEKKFMHQKSLKKKFVRDFSIGKIIS